MLGQHVSERSGVADGKGINVVGGGWLVDGVGEHFVVGFAKHFGLCVGLGAADGGRLVNAEIGGEKR